MEIEEIIKLYLEGYSTAEIAAQANVTPRYINLILKENKVERRPFGHWKRQYTLNEDYFKTWSNNMAYILGFFCADGFISYNSQQIGFGQKERVILEQIKSELGSNQPIYKNSRTGVYMLNLNSKNMKNDLMDIYGLTSNKSFELAFPLVPDQYLNHFIRGYFDGDGNINYKKYVVTFVGGSQNFIDVLKVKLEEIGLSPYISNKGKHYRLFISGRYSIKKFSEWIYTDKTLYLERKFQAFQQELLPLDQLIDRKLKRTKKAVLERKNVFLEAFKNSNSLEEACLKTNITKTTIKTWLKTDKDFEFKYISKL
jgi:intein-encoded DNA endonuclease-like protein